MINHVMRLPYVVCWLPLVVALGASAPLIWLVRFSRAAVAAPAVAAPPDPAPAGATTEQRRSLRRLGNTIGILFAHPGQQDNPLHARLLNRSLGGLCLETHRAIPIGTVLTVRPVNAEQIVPWVEVEVRVCRPH